MTKAFLIDLDKCVGCYSCQVGCKDEHCGNDWSPIARPQPIAGQFWLKLNEIERGGGSHVKVTYLPVLCQHCESCPLVDAGAAYRRDDGLVILDPAKAGDKTLVDMCPYGAVYWNDEGFAQKCTGCAHLLDDEDSPIRVPRCVDNCHLNVIQFGEEDELDLSGSERLHPEYGLATHVWYKGLPKKFIRATVYDPELKEVVIGAKVTATGAAGTFEDVTDDWGDFYLRDLPDAEWTLTIEKDGKRVEMPVSTVEADQGLPDIALA